MEEEHHDDGFKNLDHIEDFKFNFNKTTGNRKDSVLTLDYFNTMIMPNLSGMIVLEEQPSDDLKNLDLNYFSSEPMDINLNRLFQEESDHPSRKESYINSNPGNENLHSSKVFLSELNNLVYNYLGTKKLEEFEFFLNVEDFRKNIGNLSYLDNNLNGWLQNQLLLKFDSLLQNIYKSSKLDSFLDILMSVMKMSLEISTMLLKLISQCDGEYCMEVLKNYKGDNVNKMQTETQSLNQSINTSFDDQFSTQSSKRKNWSILEKTELKDIMKRYYPEPPSKDDIDLFSKKYSRTVSSISNQMQKLRKDVASEHESAFVNYYSQKLDQTTKTQNQNMNTNSISIEKSIIEVLSNFPDQQAYKNEILDSIQKRFYLEGNLWRKSYSQILSNSRQIAKVKGIYSLNPQSQQLEFPDSLSEIKTIKKRVLYILSQQPNYSASKSLITERYLSLWESRNRNMNELSISIQKILTQNPEFDVSKSKTKYCLLII